MPTTTNFGWTTPADTDLVKDGAAAIRTLAGNIDTSLVDLKGGTTGQFLSKNSNTDLDFVFATPASGGMTLISTTTLTGASVTLSSIPQTYNKLYLVIENYQPATDGSALMMRFNGVSTLTYREASPGVTSQQLTKAHNDNLGGTSGFCKTDNTTVLGFGFIEIYDYTNTTTNKLAVYQSFTNDETNPTTTWRIAGASGTSTATSAITSLVFLPVSGNFTSGSIRLYGVK